MHTEKNDFHSRRKSAFLLQTRNLIRKEGEKKTLPIGNFLLHIPIHHYYVIAKKLFLSAIAIFVSYLCGRGRDYEQQCLSGAEAFLGPSDNACWSKK
ncbi:hypothetical protein TNIN_228641 [Trichonephila inaurata madagascariensis]|uniref:Uncharacterized protein n=1 Tax=Trichonephila inaurata madagascariensis TaxID=2747483 RepID=A0A8X6YPD9_9ARAC|nr:hypothetical protein TNIN_228641 [Trichonephila inaurata madagascariensis]